MASQGQVHPIPTVQQQIAPARLPKKIRVLVVDDSPDLVEVICGILDLEDDIEVVGKTGTGTGAIQLVSELQPDLVLMDVHMPYMNGMTAALLLSQHFPAVKTILMSAENSLQMRIACRSAGAHAFIYKPAFRPQFFEALEQL